MGTVRVVLRKCRKLKDGRYPLAIRLTHNKKVKYILTGHSALEREWNGKYPTYLNTQHPNQKELNQYLFQQYSKVNSQLLEYEQTGKPYTVYDLHTKTVNKPSPTTLFNFTENYRTALNVVKRFSNGKDIHFEDITYKWFS